MLHELLHRPLDDAALRVPPDTAAKRAVKERTFSAEEAWLQHWLTNVDGTWTTRVAKSTLYRDYCESVPRPARPLPIIAFGRIFRDAGIHWRDGKTDGDIDRGRVNAYVFPPLAACREGFDRTLGTVTDWPSDGDVPEDTHQGRNGLRRAVGPGTASGVPGWGGAEEEATRTADGGNVQ